MPPSTITLEELSDYFHMPEKMVAQQMGMCLTSLTKICRAHGIMRWPCLKLKLHVCSYITEYAVNIALHIWWCCGCKSCPVMSALLLIYSVWVQAMSALPQPKLVNNWPPGDDVEKTKYVKIKFVYSEIPEGRGSTPEPKRKSCPCCKTVRCTCKTSKTSSNK